MLICKHYKLANTFSSLYQQSSRSSYEGVIKKMDNLKKLAYIECTQDEEKHRTSYDIDISYLWQVCIFLWVYQFLESKKDHMM
jgi:hypothetical protein